MELLKKYSNCIVLIILGLILNISIIVSSQESTTMDEQAHIPSAYTYVKYNDMRLNPEHPPLLKDLAGIPLQFLNVKFPTDDPGWTNGINEQWTLGNKFIHSNDADAVIFWSRFPIILITLLLGFFIYKWTRELAGAAAGLLALVLYAFDPNILGHNHYVTTDLGIAAFIFISFYYFIKFIKNPSWKNTILAGIFLGLAELAKFSAVLLFPFFALIIVIYAIFKKKPASTRGNCLPVLLNQGESTRGGPDFENASVFKYKLKKFGEYVWKYAIIIAICFVLIWILYQYNTFNMPAEKVQDVARTVFGDQGSGKIAKSVIIGMSQIPLLKGLSEYFLGVFMVFARVEGGNTYYFFGHVSNQATPRYFPAVFILKETIPFLVLILFTGGYALYNLIKNIAKEKGNVIVKSWTRIKYYLQTGVAYYAMLGFILLYSYLSITGNLNIGFRHLFPILPFAYVLVAKKTFDFLKNIKTEQTLKTAKIILMVIIAWIIIEPAVFFPSYISYFNEFAGGPKNGYQYVADSNLDWGQDLKRLRNWVDEYNINNPENPIDKIRVDYFGGSNPAYYFGDKFIPWHGEYGFTKGWVAVSATFIQEGIYKQKRPGEKSYEWLLNCRPFARIGDSIFVYYIP